MEYKYGIGSQGVSAAHRLHPIEEKEAAEKHEEDGGGNQKDKARRLAAAGNGPAETVDYACHRIQSIKPTPPIRHERAGIGDWVRRTSMTKGIT